MKRSDLEQILQYASKIDPEILVIGSQAILASFDDSELPPEATRSIEADIAFFDDPDETKSDLVDGGIGELSSFHERFGIYNRGSSDHRSNKVTVTSPASTSAWERTCAGCPENSIL